MCVRLGHSAATLRPQTKRLTSHRPVCAAMFGPFQIKGRQSVPTPVLTPLLPECSTVTPPVLTPPILFHHLPFAPSSCSNGGTEALRARSLSVVTR